MPRGARLDAPGTLHHVIIREIEKGVVVRDDEGRKEKRVSSAHGRTGSSGDKLTGIRTFEQREEPCSSMCRFFFFREWGTLFIRLKSIR